MTDKQAIDAELTAKVATMSFEQREARVLEIVPTTLTPETSQEFIKLVLGPSASIAEDESGVTLVPQK